MKKTIRFEIEEKDLDSLEGELRSVMFEHEPNPNGADRFVCRFCGESIRYTGRFLDPIEHASDCAGRKLLDLLLGI